MVTETPPVKQALDELRRAQGGEKVEFSDLVVRGARDKVRELRAGSETARRASLEIVDWIRTGDGPAVDLAAAEEVKGLRLAAD